MKTFQDYILNEECAETRGAKVYRGQKSTDSDPVIVKILKARAPSVSGIARVIKEYQSIKGINHDGVVKVVDVVEDNGQVAVVTEDITQSSMEMYLETSTFDMTTFLEAGICLAQTLGQIHQSEILHGEIRPSHIYVDPDGSNVRISDFGIVTILTKKNDEIYHEDVIRRSLYYISPEQTGRMNRRVDYRTDIYSLGIVFYEMLTGAVPFKSGDPMEVIYAHLAIPPVSPHELNSQIPRPVSDIIMKMLNKNAEQRYQNAFGLEADLKTCLDSLIKQQHIPEFQLGSTDIPRRFILPQKLYGRNEQIQTLLSCFEMACNGIPQVVMVSGNPGIGKSALVNEIHKPIVARRGFFVSGKYEQYQKDVPYSSIIQAFQGLIQQILSRNDESIQGWKDKLLTALNPSAKVITDVISDLELIIGEQPDIPDLGPEETRNRFNLLFERFVGTFARAEHPLVLFLDDLQWADFASLEVLRILSESDEISHLMIIGAYRDTQVDEDHILNTFVRQVQKRPVPMGRIRIEPLGQDHVVALIDDYLKGTKDESRELGDLVHKKTGGNPFFINQFLKTLYDHGMIQLDSASRWQWDMQKISDMQVTENLVDLLVEKINELDENTRETLKICACIGNRFDLEVIADIQGKPVEDVLENLKDAIDEGLIDGSESLYFYHHDRIQEAAYSLLDHQQKSRVHYKIAKKAIKAHAAKPLNGRLFYVTDQLNAGVEWISSDEEKDQLAWFNFEAGQKAKASAAYSTALTYYRKGLDSLGDNQWQNHYDQVFGVHVQMAEIYCLLGEIENLDQVIAQAKKNVKTPVDLISFLKIRIKSLTSQEKYDLALETGLGVLSELGIELSRQPDEMVVFEALQGVMGRLDGKSDDDLLNMPDIADEKMISATQVIFEMGTAAYSSDRELSGLLWLKMAQIHLDFGMQPAAAPAFASYGVVMIVGLGDIDAGVRFGKLAFKILDKFNNTRLRGTVLMTYNLLIRHWNEPVGKSAESGLEVYRQAMEAGELEYASWGLFLYDTYSIASGAPLQQVEQSMSKNNRRIKKFNQHHVATIHSLWWQFVLNLMGEAKNPLKLIGKAFNEENVEQECLKNKDFLLLGSFYQIKFILLFFFEEYERAFEYLEKAEAYKSYIKGQVNASSLVFLGSIARLAVFDTVSKDQQEQFLATIEANQLQMAHWMNFAPASFSHRYKMVQAMQAQVDEDMMGVMDLYDEAIDLCNENEENYEVSFILAQAAVYFKHKGKERLGNLYLKEAYQRHLEQGHISLARYFETKYPFLRSKDSSNTQAKETQNDYSSKLLDMEAVVKASQAISGEIVLGKLLTKMMQIVLQIAGAQKGFIILKENDLLNVEAECSAQDEKVEVLKSVPVETHKGFSRALVNVVARTKKTQILNHACQEGDFSQDTYFQSQQTKSVLCQAIISQGRLTGVLYLENNLATGVFTSGHLEVLEIIASQVAISIENAKLYANLEQKVWERTRELEEAYEKIILLANTDPLTQLSNRRDMLEKIDNEKVRMQRNKTCASLILSDIDDFKMINDTYGHDCGDFILKRVAQIMTSMVRQQDVIARWGGEEFLFLLPQTDVDGAAVIAEKVRNAICSQSYEFNDQSLSISMTFGVSSFPGAAADVDACLKQADEALYKGKGAGKNCVILS